MKFIAVLQSLFLLWLPIPNGQPNALTKGWRKQPTLAALAAPTQAVSWEPANLVNGSPCLFRVQPGKSLKSLSGDWQGRHVFFDFDVASGAWYGFAAVDLDTKAGQQALTLDSIFTDGTRSSSRHAVTIGHEAYRRIPLRVPRKYLEPDAETLDRIKQEQELKRDVFRRTGKDRLWRGAFSPPVNNIMTESFGVQRTFNGRRQSVHQGMDYRAAVGDQVRAMNSGEVVLTRELFFEGGFLIIDHGQGLQTLYMHLSDFKVKEGDRVNKGQIVAFSGASGRATGPHLHVGVRWQSVYLDPAVLLNLKLP